MSCVANFTKVISRSKVYKNTLVKRAMDDVGGYDDLYPHLVEQNGFAFVEEELAAPAKVIKKFNEEYEKPQFKAAIIDGDYYGEDELETLAAMKSKSEVIGDIVGLLLAPVSNVVSALQAPGKNVAGAVDTIAEKGEN
ncbi:MAG: 50S ribosomal protein L10 [Balneolaceae bacterium]|nr:50S ribosomal protein L10 [Balneolaceae bacterium]